MGEFGLAEEVTHKYSKRRMRRDSCKQSEDASGETKLKNVNEIFHRGKPHADDDGIDNSIERFIEVFIVEKDKSHKNKLAELFDKGYFEEGVKELLDNVIFFRKN